MKMAEQPTFVQAVFFIPQRLHGPWSSTDKLGCDLNVVAHRQAYRVHSSECISS